MSTLSIICVILLVLLLAGLILVTKIYFGESTDTVEEVVSSENDPKLKAISDFRTSLVNNIIGIFGGTWLITPDEMHVDIELTDWSHNLITLVYENEVIRMYVNWQNQKVKITYTSQNEYKVCTKSKKFRIKHHTLDFERLNKWANHTYRHMLITMEPNMDKLAVKCVHEALDLVNNPNNTDEDFHQWLFDVWKGFNIRKNKKTIENDLSNFTKLSAYIKKYCNDILQQYTNEITNNNLDDKE